MNTHSNLLTVIIIIISTFRKWYLGNLTKAQKHWGRQQWTVGGLLLLGENLWRCFSEFCVYHPGIQESRVHKFMEDL